MLFKVTPVSVFVFMYIYALRKAKTKTKIDFFSLVRTYLIIFRTGMHPRKTSYLKMRSWFTNVSKAYKGGALREHTNPQSNSSLDSGRSEG